ncbi:MAG TPA: cobyrinate a,c-diamide synthase [Burkholderiaceae bacterium]|nr:cobyrinate a,c-diamide synthase [Burkholderiaceae bacterium]
MRSAAVLMVAAPASGQGKTTVTAALARLHARAGRRVRVFKCGPDFLDPYWHRLASGAPVHQIDLWMTGEADIRQRLHAATQEADLVLLEGVMGLYDGEPSAAELARRFGVPVLAVVDASSMAQTFGALAHGLRHYQAASHGPLPWAGVLANRVGSERHADMLQQAVAAEDWLGALMRSTELALPERHLGLVAAHELPDALARLDAAADRLLSTPLGRMSPAELAQRFPHGVGIKTGAACALSESAGGQFDAENQPLAGRTVAVARDAALCFIYDANLDTLRQLGAELAFFSPLADAALPACDAVWLPGGYPELHAATLSANHALRDALQVHAAQGKPVWAECGGMMLLFDTLVDKAGVSHAMWGLLPGTVRLQARLAALGPQQLALGAGCLRGHTFHWSLADTPLPAVTRTQPPGRTPQPVADGGTGEALYMHGAVRASYFHAWMPSAPAAAAALLSPQPLELPA